MFTFHALTQNIQEPTRIIVSCCLTLVCTLYTVKEVSTNNKTQVCLGESINLQTLYEIPPKDETLVCRTRHTALPHSASAPVYNIYII